ncbi:hypothetical protein BFJ63_vAg15022 [Fusarium oxysporum f. sp. narcissi]|uniref:Uncharacterized protein n=1 Tax=Fusarium oxysporum f. sp. narcissi TaxID=451672 RepID=A0A4Q2VB43_FUSOX|nr:hypothetical protein BFJ63_vAg15022 [Fusarium oxysporum f. sp. narcissi]
MLVLVAGATGNLGQKLIDSLYSRGHQLECFVQSEPYYDVPAIESACKGVDAVICAYAGMPESSLDGQLLLFRAVERVGIKKYVAASWNFDGKNMNLGVHERYDAYIAFRNQLELSSDITPNYFFTRVPAEGTEFTVAIIERDDASERAFGCYPLTLIVKTYGQVRNCHVDIRKSGDEEELRKIALEARRQGTRRLFWPYIDWFYQVFTTDRLWVLEELDNDKLYVKTSSLEEFLRQYPQL